jgi:hypothetical protein
MRQTAVFLLVRTLIGTPRAQKDWSEQVSEEYIFFFVQKSWPARPGNTKFLISPAAGAHVPPCPRDGVVTFQTP